MKKLLLILALIALIMPKQVSAIEQFKTSYLVSYTIFPTGETHVEQEITIENKENDILATTYSNSIKQMEIYDVTGTDTRGPLTIELSKEDDVTHIKAELLDRVVGKGKKSQIYLSYKTKDIATKVGEVWNINLPQVSGLETIDTYQVSIHVPKTFGPLIFVSPKPLEQYEDNLTTTFTYNKELVNNTGITAAFGKYQLINFKLKYHLNNENWFAAVQEIALPPNIPYIQQVKLVQMNPTPRNLYIDADGNTMAEYKVPAGKDLLIEVVGAAKVLGKQIQPEFGGKMHELPLSVRKNYLHAQPFWEAEAEQVKQKANELFDPKKTVSQNAQSVYNFVINTLEYDQSIEQAEYVQRHGALKALTEEGPWACMEFTDLFIALTRAMGIPSRELNGYAFNKTEGVTSLEVEFDTKDLLHSWPEYYDPNFGWVMVDPTWGDTSGIDYFTKLDTNHVVFVIRGSESEYPYPAGAYKLDEEDKQVEIDFSQNTNELFKEHIQLQHSKSILTRLLELITSKKYYTAYNDSGLIIKDFNNSGKILFPFDKVRIVLEEGATISFEDYTGKSKSLDYSIIE